MAKVVVIGDGPAGLSAALFLAKNDQDVVVYGQDATALHHAHLYNYLGVPDMDGSAFQEVAREQVEGHGAHLRGEEVTGVARDGDAFELRTAGSSERADYLVIAGAKPAVALAEQVGAERDGAGVAVDTEYRTSVDRCYAVGRAARPARSQAIISAGAGAVAALDILAREAGKDVTDWDTPPKDGPGS